VTVLMLVKPAEFIPHVKSATC